MYKICGPIINLTQLNIEFGLNKVSDLFLQLVDLLVGQVTVHALVVDSVTLGVSTGLWMCELVDQFDTFNQITSNASDNFHNFVHVHFLLDAWNPEGNVPNGTRILRVWLESGDLALLELFSKSLI
ncbi:hypothetical protein WICPIJ_002411 [Wickerhamomyces pijperi]|uniref:Uncharacterized protein n=1 Tax=Wickerhamomyces pijperi TaxID=599730 RepID=A0A9P8Q917_WICPI|nr:hypothetical protein WICPIJ_002411 [Wickerhamomyces pijperi]